MLWYKLNSTEELLRLCGVGIHDMHTVKKEIKCSGNSEILNEIGLDTTRKLEQYDLIRVVSRAISRSISESPLHLISFLTV